MAENIHTFLNSFKKVKQTGPNQYICCCPAHYDDKASLSIAYNPSEDRIALHCHAGCDTADILTEVGKTWADVGPTKPEEEKRPLKKWQINLEQEYRYTDPNGNYLYSKLRYEGKRIRFARIIDGEKVSDSKDGFEAELYNVRAIKDAIEKKKPVYYVEGEKDVETMKGLGLIAVTAGGTGDWKASFADRFIGVNDLIIISDNDTPGKELTERIVHDLRSVVFKQRVIMPSTLQHGDVTDYITKEDGTRESLIELAKKAEPIRAYWVDEKGKVNTGLLADAILEKNHIKVVSNPGKGADQLLWYTNGVYKVKAMREAEALVKRYIPSAHCNPNLLRNTTELLMISADRVDYDELDTDSRYINVRNGLIKIPEFVLVKHKPDVLSTIQLNCDYDPKAKAPVWNAFKEDFCRDGDGNVDAEMLRRDKIKAGIILSNFPMLTLKMAFIQFSEEGNTGKSVDGDVWKKMLGLDKIANVSFKDLATDRWALGRVWGKRLILIGDQGPEAINNSENFKMLTGGDPVDAEMKGIQHFTYTYSGTILVSTNHMPVFNDDKGEHMAERIKFLHCRNSIPAADRDPFLRDKLSHELSGILNWALEGLKDFVDNGYQLPPCESSEALMRRYRQKYDTIYAFVSECCVRDKKATIKKTELEDAYNRYCIDNNLSAVADRNMPDRMASHGFPPGVKDGYKIYKGLRLMDVLEDVTATGFAPTQEEIPF